MQVLKTNQDALPTPAMQVPKTNQDALPTPAKSSLENICSTLIQQTSMKIFTGLWMLSTTTTRYLVALIGGSGG